MATKKEKRRVPELLAPAGTKEAFIAAVESGADAIYLGGKTLNARIGAGNFDFSEMKEAIDFAHKRKVKVYVTVNTLVKDDEIEEALAYCCELYNIGADALIIQDFGLGYLVKKTIPDFPIHLSTQGSVYDFMGVEAASKLGYERVVLAREVSLDEIKNICENTDVEIEVFCHGALCICYSGQCQMSRAIGARSGNRGACAQPCRLAYELEEGGKKKGRGYHLSPSDLNLIDYIGELADAGVASIKIEGRMKSPEYVSVVTSIYRKYLDEYRDNGSYMVSDEDRFALEQIFNRGFTTAYVDGVDEDFMSGEMPKHRGVYVGEVIASEKIKNKDDRYIVDALFDIPIEKNDVLEIGNARCKVTLIEGKYPELRVGDVIGSVSRGDAIYRMVSEVQASFASLSYKSKDWNAGKFHRKTKVTWDVIANKEGFVKCILRDDSGIAIEKVGGPFDHSDDGSAAERIKESLCKMGGTPFEVESVKIRGIVPYKIPVSKINELRRSAVEEMEKALCDVKRKPVVTKEVFSACNDESLVSAQEKLDADASDKKGLSAIEVFYYDVDAFLGDSDITNDKAEIAEGVEKFILLPAAELIDKNEETEKKAKSIGAQVIPYISNITKGKEDAIIKKEFDAICKLAAKNGIYIGNINWIKKFSEAGVRVFGDYGLNNYNCFSEVAIKTLGAERVFDSLEAFDIGGGFVGHAPLMTSEHSFPGDTLIDRKGEKYSIVKRDFSSQDVISFGKGMSLRDAISELPKTRAEKGGIIRLYI